MSIFPDVPKDWVKPVEKPKEEVFEEASFFKWSGGGFITIPSISPRPPLKKTPATVSLRKVGKICQHGIPRTMCRKGCNA